MKNILLNNRGVALILVILMISVIIAVTLQLNVSSRSEIYEAANLGDSIKLTYIAKSGFHGGEAILIEDTNNFDSLNEKWAKEGPVSKGSEAFFSEGYFKVNIEDESGKIQINKLVDNVKIKELLSRLLILPEFRLNEERVRDIIDAVKDWIDKDDEVTGFGAEDIYYKNLAEPYSCKNGPLDCIEELLMIKGITRTLYYGTDKTPGIVNYLTIHGEGKININTAPRLVLKALADGITGEMVAEMDSYRRREENDLSKPTWYKKITGMVGITIETGLITTGSKIFKITSAGHLNDMSKKIQGVITRNMINKTSKILSWKVE